MSIFANISPENRRATYLVSVCALLWLGFGVSLLALTHAGRLHPDEAFYMTSARDAAIKGDWWLIGEPLDKPPLTHYANALAIVFFAAETDVDGVLQLDPLRGEFAGRMPSLLASMLLIAVIAQLAQTLTGNTIMALVAAVLTALSPLRLVFSATAFTDMPMLLLAALSLLFAARGKSGWAGFWWILSLVAKPQSLFYLPLLLILIWLSQRRLRGIYKFWIPVMIGAALLIAWDMMRVTQGASSFYLLGQARYTPTVLTAFPDYSMRLLTWWQTVQYALGSPLVTLGLLLLAIWSISRTQDRHIWLFVIWSLGFSGLHIILTLNLFDRNQLILLPPLIVVAALSVSRMITASARPIAGLIVLVALLLPGAISGASGQYPIGGDDGRHDEIHQLADWLNSQPVATVIYDRWLDWELDYYMGAWTNKRRVYYPTPDELIAGIRALEEQGTRYIVIPCWVDDRQSWLDALALAGFQPKLAYRIAEFEVWALQPVNAHTSNI